ncbi:hypothetical protein ACE02H_08060 [Shewanella mangrovisoli]|uniref:hypothetical protein n=1 Tax=Shewanella mangrovisoli TaxID=2864211 RepID=UPI0035B9442E
MDKGFDSTNLVTQYESKLEKSEIEVLKALLSATRSVFPKADIFVVKNSENGNPVLRFGALGKKKNRVVLSVSSPKTQGKKRPVVSWGGQGTTTPKAKNSRIHKLRGIKKVFGTKGTKGITLTDIDSDAIERYVEFLKRHDGQFLQNCFDGASVCLLSFSDSLGVSDVGTGETKSGSSATAKTSIRRLSGEEIEAWLEEKSELQEPLTNYLENVLSSYNVSKEKGTKVGTMDLFLSPKPQNEKSPFVVIELKAIKLEASENGGNRTKVRQSYGQLLDYSVNLRTPTEFKNIERWLVIKHIPDDCRNVLEKLTQLDSNFSVWTYNEEEKTPLVLKMGCSRSSSLLSSGTKS